MGAKRLTVIPVTEYRTERLSLTALGCAVALAVCLLASDAHPQIPSSDCKCMECRCAAHPATDVDLSPPPTDP